MNRDHHPATIATLGAGRLALILGLTACLFLHPATAMSASEGHDHEEHAHEPHEDEGHEEQEEHDEHGRHEASEEHDEHEGHDEERAIRLAPEVLREFDIATALARPGHLSDRIVLPGEIVVNADRLAHVLPRVRGIVQEVRVGLGARVEEGQVLAVLDSRDLADARAAHLAARERLALAGTNFEREKRLFERKVAAERDYLEARQSLAEARLLARTTEQQLQALGLRPESVESIDGRAGELLTRFEMKAPFAGTIIEKHVSLGELLTDGDQAFVIADLDELWVHLSVHPREVNQVKVGQHVRISTAEGLSTEGTLTYVAPIIEENTRTALARAVITNSEGRWRPGLFVSGEIEVGDTEVGVVVPRSAVIPVDSGSVVFVESPEGFEARSVTLGRSDEDDVEIVTGLREGERYVARNAFILKSELQKDALAHAGHAH